MVLWWKRNADSLHVALELRMSCFRYRGPQWDGQHWHGEAEAPGDARGSLVLLSVWVLLAPRSVVQNKKIKRETEGGGLQCSGCWHGGWWQSSLSNLGDATLNLVIQRERKWLILLRHRAAFLETVVKICSAYWEHWLEIFNDRPAHHFLVSQALLDPDTAITEFNSCFSSFL